MSDFLAQMAASSRRRADEVRLDTSTDIEPLPLRLQGFDVIAEIKDRSPSAGDLALAGRSRAQQAQSYLDGGAAAISVLTEPERFAGDLSHLTEVATIAAAANIPVMRKDFLVDAVQVDEARAAGASGVLLIAAMLDDETLNGMLQHAVALSMFVLVEAFDADDLQRIEGLIDSASFAPAVDAKQIIVGINTRNLRTLEVDSDRLATLAPQLPASAVGVAESGLESAADAAAAATMGYRVALVGGALMRAAEPQQLLRDMIDAGRAA